MISLFLVVVVVVVVIGVRFILLSSFPLLSCSTYNERGTHAHIF